MLEGAEGGIGVGGEYGVAGFAAGEQADRDMISSSSTMQVFIVPSSGAYRGG